MSTAVESTRSPQKEWWLRALAVFTSPRGTFAALSDDSPEAAEARQEPIMAIVILAGIAGVLSTSLAGRLLDDPNNDGLNVAVWAFLGGAFYGLLAYWGGACSCTRSRRQCACGPRIGKRGTSSAWRLRRSRSR